MPIKWRTVAVVCGLWVVLALVAGAQDTLAAALQGRPRGLGAAVADALNRLLPWIPATLIAIAVASRWPLGAGNWRRNIWVHLLAVPISAFVTNTISVVTMWADEGSFPGAARLVRDAVVWSVARLDVAFLFYAATVAVVLGLRSWHNLRKREVELARLETQLVAVRLQVLSAQIRPHFLFNTLHAIGQLWRAGRHGEADAMLDHLGALFQKVIASTSRSHVPLSEELAMVRDYLAIEQARFGDRVRSRLTIDEAALGCLVPPLLLQPLVENAVKHGLAPSPAGGTVTVDARVEGETLFLLVQDDGAGPGAHVTAGTGTGLSNIRERLAGLYGQRQLLERSAVPGGGTAIRLQLPRQLEVAADA